MASRKLQPVFLAPLLALLFFSSALEAAGNGNGTSADGARSSSSSANGADAGPRGRSLASSQNALFSLDSYGARGDGRHDDTQALAKAWKAACASPRHAVVLVPRGKRYLLKLVSLSGPCKSSVVVAVQGTLVASPNRADWGDKDRRHWIVFRGVNKLTVNGGGTIDGNGDKWWQHSCKINKALPCNEAPTALSFHYCTNLKVEDLKIVNSQQIHMSIEDCTTVQLARLSITAPGTSPNTDGIHITRSKDVQVTNCKIKTGDDCMSIEDGTHNLHVSKVVCGPGHGFSIGSLGDDNSRAEVSGITIDTVQLYGTTNGARIKTYQGGSGYAKDITFQNMILYNVKNPIIIDQNYCDKAKPCKAQGSAVEVSNVVFNNIRGTTITKDAIKLNCSKNVPCHGIALKNIDLKMEGGKGATESTCQNAKWRKSGTVLPQPCTAKN
ncbi:polygalacturonase ADPG2-like [Phragmites australis]|uniref:polygalacturonase ADPG2-like n=1 Tax=Phragmites australis TaxID=29695 RepID=UPI002D76D314|nr:polygalacturonase ADPG2-like [Phragmites australis]